MSPGPRSWWDVEASNFARKTHNPIRSIVENLCLEPNPDKPMIALSIGDPTVFGNLRPPLEAIDALHESIETFSYNGYAPSVGYEEARAAVASYSSCAEVTISSKDVILCSGCSCALDLCITAISNPSQNILIPRPGFSIYKTLAEGLGVTAKAYNLRPEKGWEADLQHMEALIDEHTAAIVVNNPSNPCGSVYSRQHLLAILDVASRNYVPIIADEIYEHLVFPGEVYHSLASLSKDVPILSCSGLTKRFLIPGWRMGWIIIHDRNEAFERGQIRKGLQSLSQRIIGSNTLVQGAIPSILKNVTEEFFANTIDIIQRHAKMAYNVLSKVEGLSPVMPQGAMYMMVGINMARFPEFPTESHFVQQMITEESVFCLPSQCFDFPNYMRIVLTLPDDLLMEACQRIADFCERHYNHRSKLIDCNSNHKIKHTVRRAAAEAEGRLGKG